MNGDLDAVIRRAGGRHPAAALPGRRQAVSMAVRPLLHQAASQLREAMSSAEQDARQLLAYAAGVELARLPLLDAVDDAAGRPLPDLDQQARASSATAALDRSRSLSLLGLEGPGVFVP